MISSIRFYELYAGLSLSILWLSQIPGGFGQGGRACLSLQLSFL